MRCALCCILTRLAFHCRHVTDDVILAASPHVNWFAGRLALTAATGQGLDAEASEPLLMQLLERCQGFAEADLSALTAAQHACKQQEGDGAALTLWQSPLVAGLRSLGAVAAKGHACRTLPLATVLAGACTLIKHEAIPHPLKLAPAIDPTLCDAILMPLSLGHAAGNGQQHLLQSASASLAKAVGVLAEKQHGRTLSPAAVAAAARMCDLTAAAVRICHAASGVHPLPLGSDRWQVWTGTMAGCLVSIAELLEDGVTLNEAASWQQSAKLPLPLAGSNLCQACTLELCAVPTHRREAWQHQCVRNMLMAVEEHCRCSSNAEQFVPQLEAAMQGSMQPQQLMGILQAASAISAAVGNLLAAFEADQLPMASELTAAACNGVVALLGEE